MQHNLQTTNRLNWKQVTPCWETIDVELVMGLDPTMSCSIADNRTINPISRSRFSLLFKKSQRKKERNQIKTKQNKTRIEKLPSH
jgi:hypothetical protein